MVTLPPHLLCEVPAKARPHQQRWEPPEPDQPRPAGELPRRERGSLRGDEPRPHSQAPAPVPAPQEQAAARRAFADELSAFSLGAADPPDSASDTATQGGAKP
jgi:hypothetical protein